jgi:hypothetical protein
MPLTTDTIRTTKSEIESFKESFLWMDIKDELNDLAKRAQLEYDLVGEPHIDDSGYKIIPNSSETLIHLGDIKGRRKAVSYFLNILEVLLQILEDKKNDTGRELTD